MANPAQNVMAAAATIPRAQRDTPPAGAHTTQVSTNAPGSSAFGANLDEPDRNRDFRWPLSVRDTVPGILTDAQAEGLYRGLTYPIIADYDWWLDPNGASQTAVDRISAGYNLPIGAGMQMNQRRTARRFIFDEHLEDALRAPAYGHYAFEKVYEILQDGPAGVNGGWVAHLRKLASLPPRIISEIRAARDGGLEYIRVPALDGERTSTLLGIAGMMGGVRLSVDQLVFYVWDREGSNWAGRSMLRALYRPWFYKDQIVRVGAINIKRAGGVPYAEAGPNTTPAQMQELHRLAATFRVGENAGAALPHGAALKFAMAAGGDGAVEFIRLMNEEMATDWLQSVRKLGQTSNGSGSRALGEVLAEDTDSVERRAAGWFCNVFNRHVIEDDVETNEGPDAPYAPLLRYTPRGNPADALAGALDNAQVEGALPADSQAAALARAAAGERQASRRPARLARAATDQTSAERSQTDFADLQARFEEALTACLAGWETQRKALIDDLVSQAEAATTPAELASIAAAAPDVEWLTGTLSEVLAHGAETVRSEAIAQGHTLTETDLTAAQAELAAAAEGKATLLARSLSQSAASRALAVGTGVLTPGEVAAQVRDHLEGLTGADAEYELKGLTTKAQNTGRFAQMATTPGGTRFYASELNDSNVCDPCAEEDETEFASLDEAMSDYPGGGFIGCAGGGACRGTVVMVLPETAPSA